MVVYENVDVDQGLTPFVPMFFFSLNKNKDKLRAWCPFPDVARDNHAEQLYQDFLTKKIDNQLDFDKTRTLCFNQAQQLTVKWVNIDPHSHKPYSYSFEHTKQIEEAYNTKKKQLTIQVKRDGKEVPYVVDLALLKQYPEGKLSQNRNIERKTEGRRKLLRVEVGWFWLADEDDKKVWRPYSPENTRTIENAFISNQSYAWIKVDGSDGEKTYKINLVRMQQCLIKHLPNSHVQFDHIWIRKIMRVGPRFERTHIEYPLHTIDPSRLPPHWNSASPVRFEVSPESDTQRFDVAKGSPEWVMVEEFLNSTVIENHQSPFGCIPGTRDPPKRFEVLRIERVQSQKLWSEYQNAKINILQKQFVLDPEFKQILEEKPLKLGKKGIIDPKANEVYLFHGTKQTSIKLIAESGFTNRHIMEIISNNPYNGMFGSGLYFAEDSSKSNQYVDCPVCHQGCIGMATEGKEKEKGQVVSCKCTPEDVKKAGGYAMVLSRVIMGDPHLCTSYSSTFYKGIVYPPFEKDSIWAEAPIPCIDPSPLPVREGEQGLKYREFIVFEPEYVYPEYIIYYERK
eukprot:TRINITY_DN10966_c0_g2_i1.p1 TRINITY_DN10966_c0_g2~~TRINITY_DN10966_c0_g2_i1.p1  ORF type:complete len:594 (+),score=91.54 TRINITY_DN10966_c0_g2_i1:83-1783(+)